MTHIGHPLALAALAMLVAPMAIAQEETRDLSPTTALTLTLESSGDSEHHVVTYRCDSGQEMTVEYLNAAPNYLAIVPVEGEALVFVSAISGSGARYVAGSFEWWGKEEAATLTDLTQDTTAPPLASCTEVNTTP